METATISPPFQYSSRVQRQLSFLADLPRLATAREISKAVGLSEQVLYSLARQGKFPCIKISRMVKFDAAEVALFLASSQGERVS